MTRTPLATTILYWRDLITGETGRSFVFGPDHEMDLRAFLVEDAKLPLYRVRVYPNYRPTLPTGGGRKIAPISVRSVP